jgi:hypothetical protein
MYYITCMQDQKTANKLKYRIRNTAGRNCRVHVARNDRLTGDCPVNVRDTVHKLGICSLKDKLHWEITRIFKELGGYWDESRFYAPKQTLGTSPLPVKATCLDTKLANLA